MAKAARSVQMAAGVLNKLSDDRANATAHAMLLTNCSHLVKIITVARSRRHAQKKQSKSTRLRRANVVSSGQPF